MTSHSIYTFSILRITKDALLDVVSHFGIDSIVDIRDAHKASMQDEFESNSLKETLKAHSVYYLPFHSTLGCIPTSAMDNKGKIIYSKAIKSNEVSTGLQRLLNGIEKGCHILIIDDSTSTATSIRYTVIGRFLSEKGYKVLHILPTKHYYSQEDIDNEERQRAIQKYSRKKEAQQLGENGEEIAGLYLQKNGYTILDRNWNLHHGCELDIVALKDNILHFVEVKTRMTDKFGTPQMAINYNKIKNIRKAILEYRYRKYLTHMNYVIDSIAIIYNSENEYSLQFFEDIGVFKKNNYNISYQNR